MTEAETIRRELADLLGELAAGRRTIADFLDWEAEYSLNALPTDLREELDLLALLAEEAADGMRDKDDFMRAVEGIARSRIPRAPQNSDGERETGGPSGRTTTPAAPR